MSKLSTQLVPLIKVCMLLMFYCANLRFCRWHLWPDTSGDILDVCNKVHQEKTHTPMSLRLCRLSSLRQLLSLGHLAQAKPFVSGRWRLYQVVSTCQKFLLLDLLFFRHSSKPCHLADCLSIALVDLIVTLFLIRFGPCRSLCAGQ